MLMECARLRLRRALDRSERNNRGGVREWWDAHPRLVGVDILALVPGQAILIWYLVGNY